MSKLLLLISLFFIANCTLKNIEKNHGIAFLDKKEKSLILKKTNKNDIIEVLGPPSTTSLFDNDIWIYIEKSSTKSSFFKLGKKKDLKNNVLVLEIDNRGMLVDKKLYTLDDYQNIKFTKKETAKADKDSFVYGFISSLRQKIDSPKRRKTNQQ
tara:strand:- start:473 stop:934 length:462 start_codon:yes stop_codon:yes gene_type:complete